MLIIPRPIISDRTIVAIVLEYCSIANKMPDDAWKVNNGNSDGVDRTRANNAPPAMKPATNAAIIAYL